VEGVVILEIKITIDEIKKETINPKTGAIMIKMAILKIPAKTIAFIPEQANAAPAKPPTSVCEELDGIPHHHVKRFQIIAADIAAAMVAKLITSGFTIPFPMVVATVSGNIKKAIKLKNAAHQTAANGDNTLVETIVAIELAQS